MQKCGAYAFIHLQDHIAHKRFTDNDICCTCRNVSCFHTADEIDLRAILKKREGFFYQSVALLLLGTDIHNSDSRVLYSHNAFHIDTAHFGKLD